MLAALIFLGLRPPDDAPGPQPAGQTVKTRGPVAGVPAETGPVVAAVSSGVLEPGSHESGTEGDGATSGESGHTPVQWQPGRPGARRVVTAADALRDPSGTRSALLPPHFLETLKSGPGEAIRFTLPDGSTAAGTVGLLKSDAEGVLSVQGQLKSPAPGQFFFQRQTVSGAAGSMVGHVRFGTGDKAWRVDPTGPGGAPMLNEVRLDQVICVGKRLPAEEELATSPEAAAGSPETPGTPQQVPQTHPVNMAIPSELNGVVPLESLPGAAGVIYLDFDGEPGPFTGWSAVTRDAAPSGAGNSQIKEVWQRVAEDFQPFNLNVTTDRRVFDRATETSRQHVIITPTNDASPGSGGVAFIGSFDWTGNTVCWSFIRTGKSAAEAISHEVGHTLGLSHDGRNSPAENYFGGHGSGDVAWAPVMGVGYSRNLTQWSRGEYASANNTEDDLSIIVNNNNSVDYRTDDTGATYTTAKYLDILNNFSVSNEGIIETRTDVDAWRFQTAGGAVSLTVAPVNAGPNVDLLAEIYTSTNTPVASHNPDTSLGATVSTTLGAGDYTLRISGTGRGDPLTTGYSDYASLGAYLISGSVTNGVRHDRFTLNENAPHGTIAGTVTPRLAHGPNDISYAIVSGNTGGAFAINPLTGQITVANPSALNYEALSTRWDDPADFQLFVSLTDSTDPLLNESLRVVVLLNPVNEAPVITGGSTVIFTRTRPGVPVFTVTGSDPDRFDFPLFSIVSGNTGGAFAIDPVSGRISTTINAPTERPSPPLSLTIRATDRATPPLTADAVVAVNVLESPEGYSPGGVTRTYFEGITGTNVTNLTSHAKFPNSPDREEVLNLMDAGEAGNNYGSTARGWLLPPATGSYTFWITSDDASELRLSSNATPGAAVVRASASGATTRYQYNKFASQQSTPVTLTAGQPYYFEARHKEGTGADHLVVAWQGPGFSRQPVSGRYLVPLLQNYAPRIAAQALPVRRGSATGTRIGSVGVTEVNANDTVGSYAITGGTAAGWCALDANTGLLYVSDAAALNAASGTSATLTVRVSDHAATPLTGSGTITLNLIAADAVRATGTTQQIWTGISGGTVASLTSDARYPNSPTTSRTLKEFDTGEDYADNYGSRIRAFVVPPATGSYSFYLASDDESQLRFTTGTNYTSAAQIASVAGYTARDTWNAFASQTSAAFTLTAGQRYYLEVRHKEGGGGDFIQVAWTGPGITTPAIIPGSALQPFDLNGAPVWTGAPYTFSPGQHAPAGTLIGTVTASDPENGPLTYSLVSGNTGGAVTLNALTGSLTVANRAALVPGSPLALTIRVQDDGAGGLFPFKTATTTVTINPVRDFILLSPASRTVNLPPGQGLALATAASGRAGATMAWSKVSGPGTVVFDDPAAGSTGATFSVAGLYQIRAVETAGGLPLTLDLLVQAGASPALPGGERIGNHPSLPNHTWTGGSWQISSGGTGLPAGPSDGLYFLPQPGGSSVSLTVRVNSVQAVNGHQSMAGLMIRESNAADARYLFCGVTAWNGRRVIQRSTTGLPARVLHMENPLPSAPFAPVWLRLVRSGNTLTAFTAPDVSGSAGTFVPLGIPWTTPLSISGLAGPAATSGLSGTRGTAVLDNLVVSPALTNVAPVLTVTAPANLNFPDPAALDSTITDDARPVSPGAVTLLWKKAAGPGNLAFASPAAPSTTAAFSSPGAYQLRLTADDGEVQTFAGVPVEVSGQSMENWRLAQFGSDASNPALGGDLADPDFDGMVNLLEYALGLNPRLADRPSLTPETIQLDGQTYLRLTVARSPAATEVQLIIEATQTPDAARSWTAAGTVVEINTPDTLRARTLLPATSAAAQYLRLKVTR